MRVSEHLATRYTSRGRITSDPSIFLTAAASSVAFLSRHLFGSPSVFLHPCSSPSSRLPLEASGNRHLTSCWNRVTALRIYRWALASAVESHLTSLSPLRPEGAHFPIVTQACRHRLLSRSCQGDHASLTAASPTSKARLVVGVLTLHSSSLPLPARTRISRRVRGRVCPRRELVTSCG